MPESIWLSCEKEVVRKGVGMNLRPNPKRERRLGGGFRFVVKSWNARFVGREKYSRKVMLDNRIEALCFEERSRKGTKPNDCIICDAFDFSICLNFCWKCHFCAEMILSTLKFACLSWSLFCQKM